METRYVATIIALMLGPVIVGAFALWCALGVELEEQGSCFPTLINKPLWAGLVRWTPTILLQCIQDCHLFAL